MRWQILTIAGESGSLWKALAEAPAAAFLAFTGKTLRQVTLGDVQDYRASLLGLALVSQERRLSMVKSLLSFGHKTGYLAVNVGAAVTLPRAKQAQAERILFEDAVMQMLSLERQPRNRAIPRLLQVGGLRIFEACAWKGRDLQPRDDDGQVTAFGKGGKTRVMLLKPSVWVDLAALHGNDPDQPVFRSGKGGGHLDPVQVHRVVKKRQGAGWAVRRGLSALACGTPT